MHEEFPFVSLRCVCTKLKSFSVRRGSKASGCRSTGPSTAGDISSTRSQQRASAQVPVQKVWISLVLTSLYAPPLNKQYCKLQRQANVSMDRFLYTEIGKSATYPKVPPIHPTPQTRRALTLGATLAEGVYDYSRAWLRSIQVTSAWRTAVSPSPNTNVLKPCSELDLALYKVIIYRAPLNPKSEKP